MNEQLMPESRLEKFLSAIAYNTDIPEDRRNRLERWLGAILKRNPAPDAPYDRLELWLKAIYDNADLTTEFSGTEIEFWSDVEKAIESLVIDIEPYQAGSGDPSPENVRPISGWTGCKVGRAGKNLLPVDADVIKSFNTSGTWSGNQYTYDGIVFELLVDSDNRVTGISATGEYSSTRELSIPLNTIWNGNLYFTSGITSTQSGINSYVWNRTLGQRVKDWDGNSSGASNDGTLLKISVPETGNIQLRCRVFANTIASGKIFRPMVCSDADPTFEPYQGEVYDITFPSEAGTVYGGTLNVTTGVLTVDRASVDLGALTWTKSSGSSSRYYASVSNIKRDSVIISDIFKSARYDDLYAHIVDNAIASHDSYDQIAIHSSAYEATYDAMQFKEAMSGHAAIYLLATPITYQLTPVEVRALVSVNYINAVVYNATEQRGASITMMV